MMGIRTHKIIFIGMILGIVMLFLGGCVKTHPSANQPKQPAVALVKYFHVGESIRIVIASDYLFMPNSANIRTDQRKVLKEIVQFMNKYELMDVQVAGYLDSHVDRVFGQALSTKQAQVVANALWRDGLDTRFIHAVGYNQQSPIAWNGDSKGRSMNRRVEIIFHYYPTH